MVDAPILTAEDITIAAVKAALTPYVGTYNSRPKVYYQQAEQGAPLPFIVFHFQSNIARMDWIGATGATGLVTLKAIAASGTAARSLRATAAPGMASLVAPGYRITAIYEGSPTIGPVDGEWQALSIYRLRIERA